MVSWSLQHLRKELAATDLLTGGNFCDPLFTQYTIKPVAAEVLSIVVAFVKDKVVDAVAVRLGQLVHMWA